MISQNAFDAIDLLDRGDRREAILAVDSESPIGQGVSSFINSVTAENSIDVCDELCNGLAGEKFSEAVYDYVADATPLLKAAFRRALTVNKPIVDKYLGIMNDHRKTIEVRERVPSVLQAVRFVEFGYSEILKTDFFTDIINSVTVNKDKSKPSIEPKFWDKVPNFFSIVTSSSIPWLDTYLMDTVGSWGKEVDFGSWLREMSFISPEIDRAPYTSGLDIDDTFERTIVMLVFWRNARILLKTEENYDIDLFHYFTEHYEYWARTLLDLTRYYESKAYSADLVFDVRYSDPEVFNIASQPSEKPLIVVIYTHASHRLRNEGFFFDSLVGYLLSRGARFDITLTELIGDGNKQAEYIQYLNSEDKIRTAVNDANIRAENRYFVAKSFDDLRKSLTPENLVAAGIDEETITQLDLLNPVDRDRTEAVNAFLESISEGSPTSLEEVAVELVCTHLMKDHMSTRILKGLIGFDKSGNYYINFSGNSVGKVLIDIVTDEVLSQFTFIEQ